MSRGLAVVLGGAECVWDDLEALEEMIGGPWYGTVIAVNEAGVHWPQYLHHWVTYHPEHFERWEAERVRLGGPPGYIRWARREEERVDRIAPPWEGGSSGRLAVAVASVLEPVDRVVLCGVPLTETPHFHDRDNGEPWQYADIHCRRWKAQVDKIEGWVKSMSGRTRDLLGAPTMEWIDGRCRDR